MTEGHERKLHIIAHQSIAPYFHQSRRFVYTIDPERIRLFEKAAEIKKNSYPQLYLQAQSRSDCFLDISRLRLQQGYQCFYMTQNKDVWIYGKASQGQLGINLQRAVVRLPVCLHVVSKAHQNLKKISSSSSHAFGLTNDFQMYTWGKVVGLNVQLKNERILVPTRYKGDIPTQKLKQIFKFDRPEVQSVVCGLNVTYFVFDSVVFVAGQEFNFRLGLQSPHIVRANQPVPIAFNFRYGVKRLAAGSNFALVLTFSGKLYGWGSNQKGQLSFPNKYVQSQASPIQIDTFQQQSLIDIACSKQSAVGLTKQKRIVKWGSLFSNQTAQIRPKFLDIPEQVLKVVASDNHFVFLTTNGNLYFLGYNSANMPFSQTSLTAPTLAPGLNNVHEVVTGVNYTAFVTCGTRPTQQEQIRPYSKTLKTIQLDIQQPVFETKGSQPFQHVIMRKAVLINQQPTLIPVCRYRTQQAITQFQILKNKSKPIKTKIKRNKHLRVNHSFNQYFYYKLTSQQEIARYHQQPTQTPKPSPLIDSNQISQIKRSKSLASIPKSFKQSSETVKRKVSLIAQRSRSRMQVKLQKKTISPSIRKSIIPRKIDWFQRKVLVEGLTTMRQLWLTVAYFLKILSIRVQTSKYLKQKTAVLNIQKHYIQYKCRVRLKAQSQLISTALTAVRLSLLRKKMGKPLLQALDHYNRCALLIQKFMVRFHKQFNQIKKQLKVYFRVTLFKSCKLNRFYFSSNNKTKSRFQQRHDSLIQQVRRLDLKQQISFDLLFHSQKAIHPPQTPFQFYPLSADSQLVLPVYSSQITKKIFLIKPEARLQAQINTQKETLTLLVKELLKEYRKQIKNFCEKRQILRNKCKQSSLSFKLKPEMPWKGLFSKVDKQINLQNGKRLARTMDQYPIRKPLRFYFRRYFEIQALNSAIKSYWNIFIITLNI